MRANEVHFTLRTSAAYKQLVLTETVRNNATRQEIEHAISECYDAVLLAEHLMGRNLVGSNRPHYVVTVDDDLTVTVRTERDLPHQLIGTVKRNPDGTLFTEWT